MISFLILAQKISFAVDIVPQLGINCGDPNGDGDSSKCCKSTISKPGSVNLGNAALNVGAAILQPLIDSQTNAMVQQQKSVVIKPCADGVPSMPGETNNDNCRCVLDVSKDPLLSLQSMCRQIKSQSEAALCTECADNKNGVWTALGCFNGNVGDFITNNIMRTSIGIAGGISLLCIMFAAFQMQTSAGNAEKVKKAQELMTNCITGLMIIIFSILILKIIGVDILGIPGFK